LRQYWYPPSLAVQTAFTRHSKALEEIFEHIRNDAKLSFLDAQIYPEWEKLAQTKGEGRRSPLWLPETMEELRAGFYLCRSMIQLMENVYLDLHLEQEYDHPDNRGWMNLFKHWSWSGMFRATWAVCAGNYGARFQTFCKRTLGLTVGEVEVRRLQSEATEQAANAVSVAREAEATKTLNFLELELITDFCEEHQALQNKLDIWLMEIVVWDPSVERSRDARAGSARLAFTVGLGLVDEDNQIVYFRVRDHLRKMGLARKGLRKMLQCSLERGQTLKVALLGMPVKAREVPSEEDNQRFQRLFTSVRYERHG
jgi:hypothetical protein